MRSTRIFLFFSLVASLVACSQDTADEALPACLEQLLIECPLTSSPQNGQGSGTMVTVTQNKQCSATPVTDGVFSMEVRKANGSLCYTLSRQTPSGHGCEGTYYSWKDASGTLVATADGGQIGGKFSIKCGVVSQTLTCTPEVCSECATGHCPDNFWPDHPCVAGACP